MTKLEAVNDILTSMGLLPVAALDTGGLSEPGYAELMLDQESKRIQGLGWSCNQDNEVQIRLPLYKIAVSASAGTPTYGDTFTEASSGATLQFNRVVSSFAYFGLITGTPVGSQVLTASIDPAVTITGGALTVLTSNTIIADTNWIRFRPSGREHKNLSVHAGYIYNIDDHTTTFTEDVWLDTITLTTFANLPQKLAEYVAKKAGLATQRFLKRGTVDEQLIQQELLHAKSEAERESREQSRFSTLDTDSMRLTAGDRQNVASGWPQ